MNLCSEPNSSLNSLDVTNSEIGSSSSSNAFGGSSSNPYSSRKFITDFAGARRIVTLKPLGPLLPADKRTNKSSQQQQQQQQQQQPRLPGGRRTGAAAVLSSPAAAIARSISHDQETEPRRPPPKDLSKRHSTPPTSGPPILILMDCADMIRPICVEDPKAKMVPASGYGRSMSVPNEKTDSSILPRVTVSDFSAAAAAAAAAVTSSADDHCRHRTLFDTTTPSAASSCGALYDEEVGDKADGASGEELYVTLEDVAMFKAAGRRKASVHSLLSTSSWGSVGRINEDAWSYTNSSCGTPETELTAGGDQEGKRLPKVRRGHSRDTYFSFVRNIIVLRFMKLYVGIR